MQSWGERARWVLTTLLLSWLVGIPIVVIASATGIDPNQSVAGAGIFVISYAGAILLRRNWQAIRAWNSRADDRFIAHPGTAIGVYALTGLILSFGLFHSLLAAALGASLWALMGWFSIRRIRYRRGDSSI